MGPTGPILHHAPTFTVEEASRIAHDQYNLIGIAAELPSERDQNFLLTTHSGEKFILKIANATEQRLLLEAQSDAMTHLASRISFCPRVILNEAGESLFQVQSATSEHFVRLVTFIPGLPLAEVEPTPQLLFNFGRRLGEFSRAGLRAIDEYSPLVVNEELRMQVERCRTVLDKNLDLPSTIIHGDPNNYNVLIQDEDVVGLIDFGDMVYSLRVGDLAIALAYVVLDKMDPLSSARTVVAGYLSEVELNKDEIELVWPLMLTRLGMSICIAAHQRMQKPENEYLDVSQRAIRNSLPRLLTVKPKVATGIFFRR